MRGLRRLAIVLVAAVAAGGAAVARAPSAQAVVPAPRTVQVQMVPKLEGVTFTLDGTKHVTGPGGVAVVDDSNLNGAADNLTVTPQQLDSTTRISLDRVAHNPHHGPFTRLLQVELDVNRAVTFGFINPNLRANPQKTPYPIGKVSSITLSDSLGGTTTYNAAQLAKQPIWLPASRPAPASTSADGRLVTYSVKSVVVRGANVVNSGQQRFTPNKQSLAPNGQIQWQIPIILHRLTVEANDLLAGAPAGNKAQLTFPDGSVQTYPLGADHRIVLNDLPRGTYKLKVDGGMIAFSSTVRLSRDQTATVIVITGSDVGELALMVFSVLAVVVAAGVVGRRLRRQAAGRRRGASALPA